MQLKGCNPRSIVNHRVGDERSAGTVGDLIFCPFTVIIDTREQIPFSFMGMNVVKGQTRHPLLVKTVSMTLESGDYSILQHSNKISIERKSLEDLYSTLTHGRERFERELTRLQEMQFSVVIVEASLETIISRPPPNTRVVPKSIYSSIIAYQQRFQRTHWVLCDSRRLAEKTAFRILERYWIDNVDKPAKDLHRQQRLQKKNGVSDSVNNGKQV